MRTMIMGLAAAIALGGTALAQGQAIKPAIVYDLGGKFDKSFNEGVYTGAEKFKKDTGVEYRDFELQNDAQREQALRRFARDGYSPIVAVGFSQASALEKVAEGIPEDASSRIIDMVVDAAQRAVDRVQGAGGLVPRRPARRARRPRPARSASWAAWTSR